MSYSIPADHDIGPAANSELEIEQEFKSSISNEVGVAENALKDNNNSNNNNDQLKTLKKNQRLDRDLSSGTEDKTTQSIRRRENQGESNNNNWLKNQFNQNNENNPINNNENHHLAKQDQTLIAGGVLTSGFGASAVKRDVISVSQCCNMMETEDVSVAAKQLI